jgi:dipeptidyl aminopeptidase/acylaminoacyl peptidase
MSMMSCTRLAAAVTAATAFLIPMHDAYAQDTYRKPPEPIARILEAPPTPAVVLDPQRQYVLLIDREVLPPIADLARPMLRLAGSRIDPGTHGPHGPRTYVGLTLRDLKPTWTRPIEIPADESGTAHLGLPAWSPDSSQFAFTVTRASGIELWIVDIEDAAEPASNGKPLGARRLTGPVLNATSGAAFRWMPDGRRLLCQFVVDDGGAEPVRASAPMGPIVQESRGRAATVRTYQDLLQDTHDEALFDHYFTSQLGYVDALTGERTDVGGPAIYGGASPSPDGRYLLVSRIERPYSYLVPWSLFPRTVEIWDAGGKVVRELVRMPLRDDIPIQGVQTGPRGHFWHALEDATLLWIEALDGGDPRNKAAHRDRIVQLPAPFQGDGAEVLRTEHRYTGVSFLANGGIFVSEFDRDRRWSRTWLQDWKDPGRQPSLVWDRSTQDRYGNPGTPLNVRLPNGRWAVRVEDGHIYLAGQGATPEGDRPFLDRMSLDDLQTQRLWRCEGENLETVIDILAPDASVILTLYESPEEPPNYYMRWLAAQGDRGMRRQITFFPDPAPELRSIRRQLVTYTRDDGVALSATLYLPADYQEGQLLPLLVWAYPQEYNDPATAGQVSGSPWRFTRFGGSSHLFLLTQGYAIMDGATMPVIGDPETVNDTFVEQIVASAKAAIDKAVEMGVADRERVAVGGHSYGAFMTANLLAHSDLFRAGIARSGAYNRTLTPFGFQGERRTFWEASETYINMSPFTHAHKINEPILLIHGQLDNNAGTFPMQSERLYHAINGHGGTARLVMLPFEGHGYQARESVMHVLAEMAEWLDRYVKSEGQ